MGRKREESRGREGVEETKGGEEMGRVGGKWKEGGRKEREEMEKGREGGKGRRWLGKEDAWMGTAFLHTCMCGFERGFMHTALDHTSCDIFILYTSTHSHLYRVWQNTLQGENSAKVFPTNFQGCDLVSPT